jgi:hypothetical protein
MYLEKLLPIEDDENYDLVSLKKDESLGSITLYVDPYLVYHTKGNMSARQI